MAPRSTKTKKTAAKVAEIEVIKKEHNKSKIDDESEAQEIDINEKVTVTAEKRKRGKKIINEEEKTNGDKGSRRQNINKFTVKEKLTSNGDNSTEEAIEKDDGDIEMNGLTENNDTESLTKRRKNQKKVTSTEEKTGRNKRNIKQKNIDSDEVNTEKPKLRKGKGDKIQPETETNSEISDVTELGKGETKTVKGKKRNQVKVINEERQETEAEKSQEEQVEVEHKGSHGSKKKGQKGKKTQAKEEIENKSENDTEEQPTEVKEKITKDPKKKVVKPRKGQKLQAKELGDKVENEIGELNGDQNDVKEENSEETKPEESKKKGRKNVNKKANLDLMEKDEDTLKDEPAAKKRKVTKNADKDFIIGDEGNGETIEPKLIKGKRGKKADAVENIKEDTSSQDNAEPTSKRQRKADKAVDNALIEDKKKPTPKNKSVTNYDDINFLNSSLTSNGKDWNFKISSWNVDGIRAWLTKGGLNYIKYEKPDILCLQETKCAQEKLPNELKSIPGYHAYWLCSEKDGYAGVVIYTTKLAINVQYGLQNEELDSEGRIITAEYEHFYLINTYVPNAGKKLITMPKRLLWNDEFRKHVKELDRKKPVIICGDMNVAHNEIDLANPKTNRKNAGFTDEERSGMTDLLGDGYVDTYRHFYPDKIGAYTFWTYMMNSRAKNVGWRLDYFIVSKRLLSSVCDNVIRDQVYGSDHCPISLFLHLTTASKPKEIN